MSVKSASWLFTAAAFLLLGCKTTGSTSPKALAFDSSRNVYTHEKSGFRFPANVGRFERHDGIQFYDDEGANLSVPYDLDTSEAKAAGTVYVYPAPRDHSLPMAPGEGLGRTPAWALDEQYEQSRKAIIERTRARPVHEGELWSGRSALDRRGKKGVFEWDAVNGETVVTHLYLFTHRGWFVKYRFTYPSKSRAVVEPQLDSFMRTFAWP